MGKGRNLLIFSFLFPALFIFTQFIIYPLITTVYRSLFEFNGFKLGAFLLFDNYIATLNDKTFWKANINTLKMLVVQIFICGPFSYLLALTINEKKEKFRRNFKIKGI